MQINYCEKLTVNGEYRLKVKPGSLLAYAKKEKP